MIARRLTAGFLAGASSLIGLLAVLVMLFIVAGLFGFARDMALGVFADAPFWQSLFGAVGSTLRRLPGYLWSARLGLLVFGLVGLGLAAVDAARHRVHRAWRGQLGFIVLVGVITALVIGVQYVNREGAYAWVADQPELFSQQDVVLVSDLVIFGGSLFMSLSLSYLIWAAWTYWFSRWVVWLRAPRPSPEDEAVHTQPPRPLTTGASIRPGSLTSSEETLVRPIPSPRARRPNRLQGRANLGPAGWLPPSRSPSSPRSCCSRSTTRAGRTWRGANSGSRPSGPASRRT
ncbi:MAG: hypothetical protein WKH64_12950 [Chloroflexia bacterium]